MSTVDADDRTLVEALNTVAGTALSIEGRADQGTSGGAILVVLPDGRPGVVTRFLGPLSEARRTAQLVSDLRREGLPVPHHHLVVQVGSEVLVVQERLPGHPPRSITPTVITAIIEVNEQFAHVLHARPDTPRVPLCLTRSGHPHPRHEVLAAHGDRSRRILRRIQQLGDGVHREEVEGDDLLHIDLTPDNVLVDASGAVTGVVDWNLGAYRGDRRLALVKTRFDLEWYLQAPGPAAECLVAAEQLDAHLDATVDPATLRRYWAHRVLYQLHWTLPHGEADVVAWHLALAEERLGLAGPERADRRRRRAPHRSPGRPPGRARPATASSPCSDLGCR